MEEDLVSNENIEQKQAAPGVITLVLLAHNHLGYNALSQQPRKNEELQQRLRRAFQQATDFSAGQGVDLFIQAGDLFDTVTPSEQDRSFVAARLAQLRQAGVHAFAIGGSHDTPPDSAAQNLTAPQESYARLDALHYFPPNASELEPVLIEIRGVRVGLCGAGASAGSQGDPLAAVRVSSAVEGADISLLIAYAPIEGCSAPTPFLDTRAQISRASIEHQTAFRVILNGFDQRYRHTRIGTCEVIAAGAAQQIVSLDASDASHMAEEISQDEGDEETDSGATGFVFIGLAASGVRWCRHIPVDTLYRRQLTLQTSELWSKERDDSAATERILEQVLPLCDSEAVVHVRLEGSLTRDQYHQLNFARIRRSVEDRCFALTIDDSALVFAPDGEAGSEDERLSAREELIALADEWIAAAPDEQERDALRAAKEELVAAIDSR